MGPGTRKHKADRTLLRPRPCCTEGVLPIVRVLARATVLATLTPILAGADMPVVTPAQIVHPTPDLVAQAANGSVMGSPYSQAVARLLGRVYGVEAMLSACSESFPDTRETNATAYRDWRKDHRAALGLIARHGDAEILENAHGKSDIARQVKELYRTRARDQVRQTYRSDDPSVFQAACGQFPRLIRLPGFDIEHIDAPGLALLRAHPLPTGRP
jgi:hypothetical protein